MQENEDIFKGFFRLLTGIVTGAIPSLQAAARCLTPEELYHHQRIVTIGGKRF